MRYFFWIVPCLCERLQPLYICHHCSLYLGIAGYSSHQKSTLKEARTPQQPAALAVQCCIVVGCGALTSCHRGYKRSLASFLRLFCKQESHKAPTKAEGDLWEGINFSYINERARCTFRAWWAGPSQLGNSKGSSWWEPNMKWYSNPEAESQSQPGSGWWHPEQRCFHSGCCSCLISLKQNLLELSEPSQQQSWQLWQLL